MRSESNIEGRGARNRRSASRLRGISGGPFEAPWSGLLALAIGIAIPGAIAWILAGCRGETSRTFAPAPDPAVRHPVELSTPPALALSTGLVDVHGEPIDLRCATCHGVRNRLITPALTADTTFFHLNVELVHGTLNCQSCHGNGSHDTFVLSDGRTPAAAEVAELCGQCHGPQYRDYQHGSHGGMSGYWDLSRGPRRRNTCTGCHDGHAPAYPEFMPVSGPRDRFLPSGEPHEGPAVARGPGGGAQPAAEPRASAKGGSE